MTISERLLWLCKINGYSMNKVEKECGLSCGYLKNVKNPTIDKIVVLADYFGVSIAEIIGEETKKATADDAVAHAKLIAIFNSLEDSKKEMVIEIMGVIAKYEKGSD